MVTWIGRPSQGGFSIGWIAGSMAELEGYILYWQLCIGSKNHSNDENDYHPHMIHMGQFLQGVKNGRLMSFFF